MFGSIIKIGLGALFGGGVGGMFAPMIMNFVMNLDLTKQLMSTLKLDAVAARASGFMNILATVQNFANLATQLTQVSSQISALLNSSDFAKQLTPSVIRQVQNLVQDMDATAQSLSELSRAETLDNTTVAQLITQVDDITGQAEKIEAGLTNQQPVAA